MEFFEIMRIKKSYLRWFGGQPFKHRWRAGWASMFWILCPVSPLGITSNGWLPALADWARPVHAMAAVVLSAFKYSRVTTDIRGTEIGRCAWVFPAVRNRWLYTGSSACFLNTHKIRSIADILRVLFCNKNRSYQAVGSPRNDLLRR